LEITRRADLATRALLALVRIERKTKSAELAQSVGTTPGFLSQAMTPLVNRGWVRSEPGPSGGYTATVDLTRLSVLDVIEAVEGPTDTGHCVLEDRPCAGGRPCALHQPWTRARGQLLGELADTPLSALAAGGEA
jgi:Rrf2 family protein